MDVCFLMKLELASGSHNLSVGSLVKCTPVMFVMDYCRADLQKQSEVAPQRYKDHSTAYLAGRPPSTKNSLLPGEAVSTADQEDSD